MTKQTTYRVKRNFTAGELSGLLYGRTDNARFKNGCKTLYNMIVKPQGPCLRRPGLLYKWDLTSLLDAQFTAAKTSQELTSPENVSSWTLFGAGGVAAESNQPLGLFEDIRVISGGSATDGIRSNAISTSASEVLGVEIYAYKGTSTDLRIRIRDIDNATETVVNGTLGSLAASASAAGAVSGLTETDLGYAIRIRFLITMTAASTDVYMVLGPDTTTTNDYVNVVGAFLNRAAHAQYVERVTGTVAGKNPPRIISFIVDEENAYGIVFLENEYDTISLVFFFNGGILADPDIPTIPLIFDIWGTFDLPNVDYTQSSDVVMFAQAARTPTEFVRTAANKFVFQPIDFTSPPSDWTTDNGFPTRVGLFQQRSVFAANGSRPQTLWFSQAGGIYDFSFASPALDSDALTFTLSSGNQNKLRWIVTRGPLLLGTLGEEWILRGGGDQPLTPDNPHAEVQDSRGSEPLRPLKIGPVILFLEKIGRTVNQFVFDFNIQSWAATDLSILAPHLTEQYTIIDWTYQQTPNSIVWAIRSDGMLLGLTYQREHNVVGWHRHETDGLFKAIASIPGDSEDEVWAVVEREINGNTKWYLEAMVSEFISGDVEDARFLDSYLEYDGAATDTITGLDHLEGKEVYVLADGAFHPPITVTGGTITLDNDYSKVVVGLPYTSTVVPTQPDTGSETDAFVGRTTQLLKAYVQLYNSIGFKIARIDNDEGTVQEEEIVFRLPEHTTNEPVPTFTGFKTVDFPEGFGRSVDMRFSQDKPLPLTIVSIVDEIGVSH